MTLQSRESSLARWFLDEVQKDLPGWSQDSLPVLEPVSGDASFRRYFRVHGRAESLILVDAPPQHEDCRPFVSIADRLRDGQVPVPVVHAVDYGLGFMCLSDFGNTLLWEPLHRARQAGALADAGALYRQAFTELVKIQRSRFPDGAALPPYDHHLLLQEMVLFRDWFCEKLLRLDLSRQEHAVIDSGFQALACSALAQPTVAVHRDYHSRNLMVTDEGSLGIIDFQDAVNGPVTYDLVSLLRDCYIAWPKEQVYRWMLVFLEQAVENNVVPETDPVQFREYFDLMGMQRHLKAIGIFSRLHLRDGKPRYLQDIPRCLNYLLEVAGDYPATADFNDWLQTRILPIAQQHPLLHEGGSR